MNRVEQVKKIQAEAEAKRLAALSAQKSNAPLVVSKSYVNKRRKCKCHG